jgi:transcriptional regulator with XRE-family HTH domain
MDMPIQATLRMLREFAEISTHVVGLGSGLTSRQVEDFECGDYRPSPTELLSMARVIRAAVELKCKGLTRARFMQADHDRKMRARLRNAERTRAYRKRLANLVKARERRWASREHVETAAPEPVAASLQPQAG